MVKFFVISTQLRSNYILRTTLEEPSEECGKGKMILRTGDGSHDGHLTNNKVQPWTCTQHGDCANDNTSY